MPDTLNANRRKGDALRAGGGTLLTSPAGVASNQLTTAGNTLLGG